VFSDRSSSDAWSDSAGSVQAEALKSEADERAQVVAFAVAIRESLPLLVERAREAGRRAQS
jgi:hypothetical protein